MTGDVTDLNDQIRREAASLRASLNPDHVSYRLPKSAVQSQWDFLRGLLFAHAVLTNPQGPALQDAIDFFGLVPLVVQVRTYKQKG